MGTFPPRECGIATFTQDLTSSISKNFSNITTKILAMNKFSNVYNYSNNILYQIDETNIQDYIDIAKKINQNKKIKLINIQHEFGIFGGKYGDYLIAFLEILTKPVIVTFHSVIPEPNTKRKRLIKAIEEKAEAFIVMTPKAVDILKKDYHVKINIEVVPHGIPNTSLEPSEIEKSNLGYKDKLLLSSFGLIGPGKGYEYVIDALPEVVKKFPNLLYLIVGETHPVVRKNQGETYRTFLENKVKDLNLQNNVKFYNKYLTLQEIIKYLKATDIYISSSQNPDQITSGTLVYAMGCACSIISTPFLHAKDLVTENKGILTKFNNSDSFKQAILNLAENKTKRKNMAKDAYYDTRNMTWDNVALSYMDVFTKHSTKQIKYKKKLPDIKLDHLNKMTDDFGMIQFSNHTFPKKESGYTLDDNARALLVSCMHYNLFRDNENLTQIKKYLNLLEHVQQQDGRLFNYINKNKETNLTQWTDDAQGRAIWALGYTIKTNMIPEELKQKAKEIFTKTTGNIENTKSPRAVAFIIAGLYFYNKECPSQENINKIEILADHLLNLQKDCSKKDWCWFENKLTYSNSKLSEALLYAYLATKNKEYLEIAETTLNHLNSLTFEENTFIPIGNKGWFSKNGKKAYFDQQPIDTGYTVQTLVLAYKLTKNKEYLKDAITTFQWFLGNNSLKQIIYDDSTGGCRDGIGPSSINLNQGAESTLSYLLARLSLEEIQEDLVSSSNQ